MDFIVTIFHIVWTLYEWFRDISQKLKDIPVIGGTPPVVAIAYLLAAISSAFFSWLTPIAHWHEWWEDIVESVQEYGIWETIKSLILGWLPGLEDVIVFFENIAAEAKYFLASPVEYLRNKWKDDILPWAIANIPFIATIYHWFLDFIDELELFFQDPVTYLRYKWNFFILPWAIENIPFFSTLYHWFLDFSDAIDLFFQDPGKFILETIDLDGVILSWLKTWFPFYDDLVKIWGDMLEFFTDPWEWLLGRFTDWVLGPEG